MVMIPPLVRDPPLGDRQSSNGHPVSGRMVRPQRRYASNFNISFVYEPPRPIPRPGPAAPESTFDKWRAAAAELEPQGGGGAPDPAARGDAAMPGVAPASRRRLHDVLLGTTAVVLLGVLGGIGYHVWSGAVPGAAAPGGTAPKGSGVAAVVQPVVDFAAKAVTRGAPDHAPPPPPREEATAAAPNLLALATPSADKPALTGPPLPAASGASAMAGEAAPAPERVAAGAAPQAKPSEPDAAPPVPATPSAAVGTVPAPERAAAATVPSVKPFEPDATLPPGVPTTPSPAAEPATAKAVPPASDAAPAVPAIAAVTVRLPPAPEWTTGSPAAVLASLAEAAAAPLVPLAPPVVPASPMPPVGLAAVPEQAAKAVPPGVDAQQVVSTMTLVQQMSLMVHDMHDEGLRYRTEMTALSGAVQAKASSLEERLKLAEARNAAGSDAGGPQAGLPASDVPPVLRGYRVQAGSPGAAVLTDMGAGAERAARLLVMVGDQLPGAGRVTAIVQRGRAWIVRTERGVIQ